MCTDINSKKGKKISVKAPDESMPEAELFGLTV